jgi:ribosomal protein L7/L12
MGGLMNAKIYSALRVMTDAELIQVLFQMAEQHPQTFIDLMSDGQTFTVPFSTQTVRFSRAEMAELRTYGITQKVTCIKRIREFTQLGLKEAKDLCEAVFIPRTY